MVDWKSTIDMMRSEMESAVAVEIAKLVRNEFGDYSDERLANLLAAIRGGYAHGHDYSVVTVKD